MHQILSYQTAMRAAHERDTREYITRRICISFVFSVGFFTLIAGFLLGKFVSDRQHLIKQMKQEQESSPIRKLELTVNQMVVAASNLSKYQNAVLQPDSNTKLWFSWKECFVIPETANYDLKPVEFTRNLVHKYVKLMDQCFSRIAYILANIDDH